MKKLGFMIGVVSLITACSSNTSQYASSDKQQYLKSKNGPVVVVPAPLTSSNISDFYNLPAQPQQASVSIAPPVE